MQYISILSDSVYLDCWNEKEEIFKFKRSFERLSDLGWILENNN